MRASRIVRRPRVANYRFRFSDLKNDRQVLRDPHRDAVRVLYTCMRTRGIGDWTEVIDVYSNGSLALGSLAGKITRRDERPVIAASIVINDKKHLLASPI